jgi:hypothetical protein
MARNADEINKTIDSIDLGMGGNETRAVVWDLIEDVLDSVEKAAKAKLPEPYSTDLVNEVRDYVTNHYGDD